MTLDRTCLGSFVFAWVALLLPFLVTSQSVAKPTLAHEIELDRPKVLRGYDGPIYVLINLQAEEIKRSGGEERPPINLGLVLDRSGSMSEVGKMEYLKRAASMAVDQLDQEDRLSIVEYDDQISVLWPAGPVESPFTIKRLIEELTPRGWTNLTGGMMRGVDEVYGAMEGYGEGGSVNRVLLLSDGLANQGITDPSQIRNLVQEARRKGVQITTLGLGREYDEDLMQQIAEYGGGHYYYIEHPNQMARIFSEELMTIFDTVASDVSMGIRTHRKVSNVELVSFDKPLGEGNRTVDLADFYSNETRTLVVRLETRDGAFSRRGKVDLGTIDIEYYDRESKRTRRISQRIDVNVVTELAEAEAAQNKDVMVETALLETERQHRDVIKLYEAGEHDKANQAMSSLTANVKTMQDSLDDDRLAGKIEALEVERNQMDAASAAPEEQEAYLKKSKQRLYQAKSGKRSLYTLKEGDKGLEVERLQQALKDQGLYDGPIDGLFSTEVKSALLSFQEDTELDADGIAGPATQEALGLY